MNPVAYEGGELVFIDTEYDTWNMDPEALKKAFEIYPDVRLIVVAHLYGTPGKIDKIRRIRNSCFECLFNLIEIIALEYIPCPCCGGELFTRGTCRRQAINSAGDVDHYQLRVLQCRNCKRTHRELPAPLVPYKRYDGEAYVISPMMIPPCL